MYTLINVGENVIYQDSTEGIKICIPQEDCIGLFYADGVPSASPDYSFRQHIVAPSYGKSIHDLVREKHVETVSIILSDSTRHVPNQIAVPIIIDELLEAGVELRNILFIVALGVHRNATEDEIREAIGDRYYGKVRVINSEPYNEKTLVFLGNTSFGTPLKVNRAAYECDLHISIGKVEPHCFAGYSGGRKSVLPGIAAAETIAVNHRFENITDPFSIPGEMERNRINCEMNEAASMYRIDFTVQFVVTDNLEPSAVFAGELTSAHEAAIQYLKPYLNVLIPEKPDIIVTTTGVPKNINFYQGSTSFVPLLSIINKDCVVVYTCDAREGIDSEDMQKPFHHARSIQDVKEALQNDYNIQMDAAVFTLRLIEACKKVIVYSPNLSNNEIAQFFMVPCPEQHQLIKLAYQFCGKKHPRVLFLPRPQTYLPVLSIQEKTE